jgi:2-oxoglutarate ferredoxin oxidoreductase subunit delta
MTGRGAVMRYWRTPLDIQQVKIPRGEIHLIIDRCKGCEFCVQFCPRGVLQMSKEFNAKGYHYPEVVDAENCVNCDLCEVICPDFAIFCLPAVDEQNDERQKEAGDAVS